MSSTETGPQLEALRTAFRQWLELHLPASWRDISRGTDEEHAVAIRRAWGERLAEGGWAAPGWPVELGGRGLVLDAEILLMDELVRVGAPEALNSNAIGIFGPLLHHHGTDEQKRRFLPPMLDHSEIWCQGFSEPDAGSDLASLKTHGELEGDRLIISGQKVWTSFARHADYCYALIRTDRGAAKHAGISMVMVDMGHSGVTVRPLRTLVGGWEFAEVFFDHVPVPLANVVGNLNNGWPIAVEALALERGRAFAERSLRMRRELSNAARACAGADATRDPLVGRQLVESYLDSRRLTSVVTRVLRLIAEPDQAVGLAALAKLHWSEAHQRLLGTVMDALANGAGRPGTAEWVGAFLYSRGETIYAGTSEIQRNTIARAIGLPSSSTAAEARHRPRVRAGGTGRTDDQRTLRDGLESLLDQEFGSAQLTTALEGGGFCDSVWRALGAAGWLEVAGDEIAVGGQRTLVELGEVAGARLVPGPMGLVATLVMPLLMTATGWSDLDVADVGSGDVLAVMVLPDAGTPAMPRWTEVGASELPDGRLRLNGEAREVPFATHADWLLVPLEFADRLAVAVVSLGATGVTVGTSYGIDHSAPVACVSFADVELAPAALLGGLTADHRAAIVTGLGRYLQWLDGEAVGGAEEMLKRTIEYVRERRQFGVPVGSFQAVKHLLADAYGELELARGHAYDAALAVDRDAPDAGLASVCSRLICARMYPAVVERCIQAQGGVAFTWEHQTHFWYRAGLAARHHPFPAPVLEATIAAEAVADAAPLAIGDHDQSVVAVGQEAS